MKIAVYHNQLPGGAARVMEAYLAYAADRHEVELFTTDQADTGFLKLDGYVKKTHRFTYPGSSSILGRYQRVWGIKKFGREVAAAIDAGNFDVVFANLSFLTQSPEILPFVGTPSLYFCPEPLRAIYEPEPANSPRERLKKAIFWAYDQRRKHFDRQAIRRATTVCTNSRFTQENLRRTYGVASEVVYGGVDSQTFRPGKTEPRFVLSVGALHPLKGHSFVVEALATIPQTRRPKLVVVGSRGDYAATLTEQARQQHVELEIKYDVSTAELVKLYQQAHLLAAAAHREPFGLTPLEAMACARPVVAVAEGGFSETIQDHQNGLLTPRDPELFGQAIHRLVGEPALATQLGKQGREDVVKRWSWSKTATHLDRLLKETAALKKESS